MDEPTISAYSNFCLSKWKIINTDSIRVPELLVGQVLFRDRGCQALKEMLAAERLVEARMAEES